MNNFKTNTFGAICLLSLALASCSMPGTRHTGASERAPGVEYLRIEVPTSVAFERGYSTVRPGLALQLRTVAKRMKSEPGLRVLIMGPGDEGRSASSNQLLSEDRAQSTRDYLIALGADITRMRAEGRPSSRALAIDFLAPPG